MKCNNCGTENAEGAGFCAGCGAPLGQQAYAQAPVQPQAPVQVQMVSPEVPEEYTPISMWGYFGYELLFSIPCVGLICLIIFSFTAKNKNVKNFARSYFCYTIIIAIIAVIILASTGLLVGLSNY